MAEDHVTRDQHRADLAELRLELTQTLASLDKRVEVLTQMVADLRQDMREWRTTTQRQMWVIVAGIMVALLKTVFFP